MSDEIRRSTQRVAFTTDATASGAEVPAEAMSVSMGPAVASASPRSSRPAAASAASSSDSPRSRSGAAGARSSPRNNGAMGSASDGQRNSEQSRDPSSSPDSGRSHPRHGKRVERSSPSDGFDGKYAVEVKGVTHSYGGKKGKLILNNLDLSIEQGTIYGLLGPSGCGQSLHSANTAHCDCSQAQRAAVASRSLSVCIRPLTLTLPGSLHRATFRQNNADQGFARELDSSRRQRGDLRRNSRFRSPQRSARSRRRLHAARDRPLR